MCLSCSKSSKHSSEKAHALWLLLWDSSELEAAVWWSADSNADFANHVPFWCDTDQEIRGDHDHNHDHNYENGIYANKSYHDEGEYDAVFDNNDDPDHDYDGDDEDDRNLY